MEDTQEMQIWSLSWEDRLEEEMTTHSNILDWKIPWTKEAGRLQFMGPQITGHDWAHMHASWKLYSFAYSLLKNKLHICYILTYEVIKTLVMTVLAYWNETKKCFDFTSNYIIYELN